jgi:hypothetical protein
MRNFSFCLSNSLFPAPPAPTPPPRAVIVLAAAESVDFIPTAVVDIEEDGPVEEVLTVDC